LVSADKGYTPLNLSDNIISDIVEPNMPDTLANIKQKSLHGRYFKELEQPAINIQASHAWLKKSNIHPETEDFIFAIKDRVINTRNYKKHICGLQSIIDKCRICGTEGETIEHIISSCSVLAQSEYKKRHDIFAKIIHMNLAVKFNLLKNTQPHYTLTGNKNGTLISQQQIIPIIPILMYFDQEAMIANITLNISIGYFISNFA
jgi:hypothetical protein